MARLIIYSIIGLGLLGYAAVFPVTHQVIKTDKYMVGDVKHSDDYVDFGVKRTLEGKQIAERTMSYYVWPQLRNLKEGDIVVHKEKKGKTLMGLAINRFAGRETPILDWPSLSEVEIVKPDRARLDQS